MAKARIAASLGRWITAMRALARRYQAGEHVSVAAARDDARERADDGYPCDRFRLIAESEQRYRALVEATTEILVQRDGDGRITYASDGFAALVGRAPMALLGERIEPEVLERGPVRTRPDGVRQIEERVRGADGRERWLSFVEMPVGGRAGPQRLRAGSDVTERVEATRALDEAATRAQAASVAKSRFLATVSHEFRTPLNGILGMADLVMDTRLDAEQRTYLNAIRTSGAALLGLIDGILDFSRIEAGRLELAAAPFDVAALAESVVELLAPRAQDKGLEIALDVADGFADAHVGDADRVRQILLNLAGNAVKFTATGGVGVTLAQEDCSVVIAVSDTGPGIAEARLPQLFEEFEQGDPGAGGPQEGTGLGLAITRGLVARMDGRIAVDSTPGRGTTFRVSLPLPPATPAEAASRGGPLDGRRVLVVADSPFQAPFLARCLIRSGAATTLVSDVAAALAALAGARFDALIADRGLGDAALRELSEDAARSGVRCRLVLLSPFDRREATASAAAGFDSYLVKPVRARSLFDRLLEPRWAWRDAETTPAVAPSPMLHPVPQPVPRPMPIAATGRSPGSGIPRVLLAEDNPINALLATKALERLGAEVMLARDGLAAVEAVAEQPPFDLALIDIRMPSLDGLEAARRIRAREVETGARRLPLVALTANVAREDERAARDAGFDAFLAKPLDLNALAALVARHAEAA